MPRSTCRRDAAGLGAAARAELLGYSLHAGYAFDFVGTLHPLVPLAEHLVRHHLRQAGA